MIRVNVFDAPPLTPAEAKGLTDLALRAGGISVAPAKRDFIRNRLARRLRELDCTSFGAYLARATSQEDERQHLVEALTTHTTSFFREAPHYAYLRASGLPRLVEQGAGVTRPLCIWSAACSTGAELWSAAMLVEDYAAASGKRLKCELVGTDISRPILKKAVSATFSESEIASLPEGMRQSHLLRAPGRGGRGWVYRITSDLRANVRWDQANLLDLGALRPFTADIVFLRNVLIYFKPEDQAKVVLGVVRRIRPGGFLMTGHTESLSAPVPGLRPLKASIYERV